MAYVLGLIITDGCISQAGTVSLAMNDSSLLEKVKTAMDSSHKITPSKHQKGLYCFQFGRKKMTKDLAEFGIKPKKSLNVKFPEIPDAFKSDFIRGIFDGDGCVYFDKRSKNCPARTNFCSGSKEFIIKLELGLQELGLPKRKIYEQKTKNGIYYMFEYGHKDSKKLFEILYKNTSNNLFLERKYNKFLEGFKKSDSYGKRT
ncbi:MAG: LAGLIDADG family homing endonuclease [Candidatus Omnitrophota bacterium]